MIASLAHIWRHPIKSHGREQMSSVELLQGQAMPNDRRWAITHERTKYDASTPQWAACANFTRGAIMPALTAIECRYHENREIITLWHPEFGDVTAKPNEAAGAEAILEFSRKVLEGFSLSPKELVELEGRAFTDTDYPSISINSIASLDDLTKRANHELVMERWRGNLWIDGLAPWLEFDLIGKQISIGDAILEIKEPIKRCSMTTCNPETGQKDFDTLKLLRDNFSHQNFGVYAHVIKSGQINISDKIEVLS